MNLQWLLKYGASKSLENRAFLLCWWYGIEGGGCGVVFTPCNIDQFFVLDIVDPVGIYAITFIHRSEFPENSDDSLANYSKEKVKWSLMHDIIQFCYEYPEMEEGRMQKMSNIFARRLN